MAVDLGAAAEFEDGAIRVVQVGDTEVGVNRTGERFFAFRNVCAHQGGPIGCGAVVGGVTFAAVGEPLVEPDVVVVVCPWHHWEFELPSGRGRLHRRYRLKTYPVFVENGRVLVDLGSKRG